MATTPLPRWVDLLNQILTTNMKKTPTSISYALATTSADDHSLPGPRVRQVVHRGFVNERRPDEDAAWSVNEAKDSSGKALTGCTMLVTTDVRGPKATQLKANKAVEINWWFPGTSDQFRIHANAWIFPASQYSHLFPAFPLSTLSPPNHPSFSWESERLRIYRKMSPELRASFVRPVPGTPLHREGKEDIDPSKFPRTLPTDLEAKTEEEKRLVKEALDNFSLIVLEPVDVDLCDLAAQPNERTHWFLQADGKWVEEKVVP